MRSTQFSPKDLWGCDRFQRRLFSLMCFFNICKLLLPGKLESGTMAPFRSLKRLLHRKIKQAGCVLLLQVGRLNVGKVLENRKTLTIQILLPQNTIDYHYHTDTNTFHRSTSHHITTSSQHLCPALMSSMCRACVVGVVLAWPLALQWRSAAMA